MLLVRVRVVLLRAKVKDLREVRKRRLGLPVRMMLSLLARMKRLMLLSR
jgi:hypothetical protein